MTEHDDTRRVRPMDLAADDPLPSGAAEPVDVAQVRADEALIEALRGSAPVRVDDPIDDRLAGLLQAWRDDVDAEPVAPLDLDATMAALTPAPEPRRRFPIGPLASAAAVAMIAFVGLGIAANGAAPGDTLFAITKVVNPERAQSLEAAATVRRKLDEATAALESGELGRAHEALEQAKQELPEVTADGEKQTLETKASEIASMIEGVKSGGVTSAPQTPTGTGTPSGTAPAAPPVTTSVAPEQPPVTTTPEPPPTTTTETQPEPTTTPNAPSGIIGGEDPPSGGGETGGESGEKKEEPAETPAEN